MIERNKTPLKHDQDDNNDNNRNPKKIKFAKSEEKKRSWNKTVLNNRQYYCKKCGTNSTHGSKHCYFLKRLAREANNNGNGKAHAKPYSKRTFRKEVNSMARCARKHNGLKIVESALKREQGKLEKQASSNALCQKGRPLWYFLK
jgi:hypothetical protein